MQDVLRVEADADDGPIPIGPLLVSFCDRESGVPARRYSPVFALLLQPDPKSAANHRHLLGRFFIHRNDLAVVGVVALDRLGGP